MWRLLSLKVASANLQTTPPKSRTTGNARHQDKQCASGSKQPASCRLARSLPPRLPCRAHTPPGPYPTSSPSFSLSLLPSVDPLPLLPEPMPLLNSSPPPFSPASSIGSHPFTLPPAPEGLSRPPRVHPLPNSSLSMPGTSWGTLLRPLGRCLCRTTLFQPSL